MKKRDESIAKIPPNVDDTIKNIKSEMNAQLESFAELKLSFEKKVDREEFKAAVDTKLDSEKFLRVFPADVPATDTLKNMIRVNSEQLSKRVFEMVKLWDQKIVNLRGELNI